MKLLKTSFTWRIQSPFVPHLSEHWRLPIELLVMKIWIFHSWCWYYPSCHWARGRVPPGQVASPSQGDIDANETHTHSQWQFRINNESNMHVFGWWEEAGVPGENPHIHGENMQTPHRKAPAGIPTLRLAEATVLTTTSLCSLWILGIYSE